MANKHELDSSDRDWYIVDASGLPLGRLASEVATVLQGKHKPTYTPHVDVGDFVVVVNAAEIRLTGDKLRQKKHYTHSGYLGNLKEMDYEELLETDPTLPVEKAVKRMLPKNNLGRKMFKKLKVYADSEHPHNEVELQELDI